MRAGLQGALSAGVPALTVLVGILISNRAMLCEPGLYWIPPEQNLPRS